MSLPNKLPPDLLQFSESMPAIVWNAMIACTAIIVGLIAKAVITRILKYYEKKADYQNYSFFSIIYHSPWGSVYILYSAVFFKHCIANDADG